jgi:hypothetical protein
MTLVYMAHPYNGSRAQNLSNALLWLHWLSDVQSSARVIAPWIAHAQAVEGTAIDDEIDALDICFAVIDRCDELWLCGSRMSPGMEAELGRARRSGIAVRSFLPFGARPPAHLGDDWRAAYPWPEPWLAGEGWVSPTCENIKRLVNERDQFEESARYAKDEVRELTRALETARNELEQRPTAEFLHRTPRVAVFGHTWCTRCNGKRLHVWATCDAYGEDKPPSELTCAHCGVQRLVPGRIESGRP